MKTIFNKQIILGILIGIVTGFTIFKFISPSTDYIPLYGQIDSREAARVLSKLEEWTIPYVMYDSNILVQNSSRDEIITRLASEDIFPKEQIWSDYDEDDLNLTDINRKMRFDLSIENSIEDLFRSLHGVIDADVSIGYPEIKSETEPLPVTASISLTLKSGYSPQKKDFEQVLFLISDKINGLKVEDIYLTDGSGNSIFKSNERF